MIVLVAGAHGRVGSRVLALLLSRGHTVRALVRTQSQADALETVGAQPVLADLRGDVEWTADGCDAAVFAAGARHRPELAAIDAGGAAKLAEAADRFELRRFVLCSAVGAGWPRRREGPLREFLTAKHAAERRVERLDMPWTILRFGRLTEAPGSGRISTSVPPGTPVTLNRDDAALAIVEALGRTHLGHQVIHLIDGDRRVSDALDAVEPRPLPAVRPTGLGAAQPDNPPTDRDMLRADASPLDADVDYEGDGPLPPELLGPRPRNPLSMDRKTPSVSDVVRRAVELCDPDDVDQTLGRLEQQFEDDDEPITAVENLEERVAIAVEGADYDGESPAVAVASALVFYLAAHPGEVDSVEDPDQVIGRAVRAQWRDGAPRYVADWLSGG